MLNIFYGDMKEAVYNTAAYFNIRILNTNQVVHSMDELVPIAGEFV